MPAGQSPAVHDVNGARIAALLLGLGWLALGAGLLADIQRGSPEGAIRQYLADLEGRRVEAALAALTPRAAARWRAFVEFQQQNHYEVVSVAVRSPSLLEALSNGRDWRPDQVTLVVEVREPSGLRWRGSTLVPVDFADGRWLLARPPFAVE